MTLTPEQNLPAIKGFLETSFIDWPERLCAVVFLGGCNFRCPYCHNYPLVLAPEKLATLPVAVLASRLQGLRKWLGGICVTGGEPTLDPLLPNLLRWFKKDDWQVKLDTNGSRPEILQDLLAEGLVDMVAMDVKARLDTDCYNSCTGVSIDLEPIRRSIALVLKSGIAHEFRMTVLPALHPEKEIRSWAEDMRAISGPDSQPRLKLQNFNPHATLKDSFQEYRPFLEEDFVRLQRLVA